MPKGWKWYIPLYGIGIPMWVQVLIALYTGTTTHQKPNIRGD